MSPAGGGQGVEVFRTYVISASYDFIHLRPDDSSGHPAYAGLTPLGNSPDVAPAQSPANAGEDIKWLYLLLRHSLGGRSESPRMRDRGDDSDWNVSNVVTIVGLLISANFINM